MLGVSQLGGLYIFSQDSLKNITNILYPDILFYPDAIDIQGNKIIAGTNIGLVEIDIDSGSLTTLKLTDPWYVRLMNWIKRNLQTFVNIGVPAAIALIIILVVLLLLSLDRKRIIKERNKKIEDLNKVRNELTLGNGELTKEKEDLGEKINDLTTKGQELEEKNNELVMANKSLEEEKNILDSKIITLEREKTNLTDLNKALTNYNESLETLNKKQEDENVKLKIDSDKLKNDNMKLTNEKKELKDEVVVLTVEKNELTQVKDSLDKRIADLTAKERELDNMNKTLRTTNKGLTVQQKKLTEAIETLKKEFTASHEQVKEEVLFQNRRMLRNEWSIGSDLQTKSLSHYQIFVDYISKKEEIEKKISELEFGDTTDDNLFHNKLNTLSQSIHENLFTPLLKVDACALREWVINHEEQLLQKSDEKFVKVFREQIEDLVKQYFTEESIAFIPGVRGKQSYDIFLRICAAALMLIPPQLVPTEKKRTKAEENRLQKVIERVNSPRYLHPLLIQYKWEGVSKNNFEAKKSDMKDDFELFLKAKKAPKSSAYNLSFVVKNDFLEEALKRLFKMENE